MFYCNLTYSLLTGQAQRMTYRNDVTTAAVAAGRASVTPAARALVVIVALWPAWHAYGYLRLSYSCMMPASSVAW